VLRPILLASVLLLVACASTRGSRCAPIDPELFLEFGGLYDECTVDQRARMTGTPRIDYPGAPPRGVNCLIGVLRFVVDTTGRVLPQTVQVAAANDQRYIEVMVNYLPQLRFAPGKVKGRAVHQIARWESRTMAYNRNSELSSTAPPSC
jgi:hypothetical protein